MKKALVIGSNSFSGSDFIDLLLEGDRYEVIGVSRSPEKNELFLPYKKRNSSKFRFFQVDLNKDLEKLFIILEVFKPDFIVNFAAQSEVGPSWKHPDQWFQTNVVTLTRLADRLKDMKFIKRYVHISSPEIYGSCKGNIQEDAPLNPSTPYAASKAAGDLSLFTYFKNFGLPLVVVRSTNVYGAHQQLFKIIPLSVIFLRLCKQIELHGGGKAIKSYIHIRDVSRGELAIMEHGVFGEIYHLSPDSSVAVRDVVKMVCNTMNASFSQSVRDVAERLGQDMAYTIDSSKARQTLGWKPLISLSDGISQTADWILQNLDLIQKEPLVYVHKE